MKKKLLFILLAVCLIIPSTLMFTACDDGDNGTGGHKHVYAGQTYYKVDDGKAYSYKLCECGEDGKVEKLTNYVITTPNNAQNVLDGSLGKLSGKTVVFADGDYSHLKLRSSRNTLNKIYEYNYENPQDLSVEVELSEISPDSGIYHYQRELKNVKFVATNNANFNGLISIQSKHYGEIPWENDVWTGIATETIHSYDIVRGVTCDDVVYDGTIEEGDLGYVDHITLEGVTFENMKFSGAKGRVFIGTETEEKIKDLTFTNCIFETEESYVNSRNSGYAAIVITHRDNGVKPTRENITVNGCEINGHYQGIYIDQIKNATVTNNIVQNTDHNAFAIQADVTGDILIDGNYVVNTGDRAIRFGTCNDVEATISNNMFVSAVDGENEIFKTQPSENTTVTFISNGYEGVEIEDDTYTATEQEPKIVVTITNN